MTLFITGWPTCSQRLGPTMFNSKRINYCTCDEACPVHGEGITEIEAENLRLQQVIKEHLKFFQEILFTEDGHKVVGISRNAAIRAFDRHVYVARALNYGKPYPKPRNENVKEDGDENI